MDAHNTREQTSSADAYGLLLAGVILVAVLGYAALAAVCYGIRLMVLVAARTFLRGIRSLVSHRSRVFTDTGTASSRPSKDGNTNGRSSKNGGSHHFSAKNGKATSANEEPFPGGAATAAAAAAAATIPGGGLGLWDEALMTLLGGPGPPDPFPEDSLPDLDGPAIDRQPAPGSGARNGDGGRGRAGGGNGAGEGGSNGGGGGGGGHHYLRSLSGELVMWPTAPNDGRTFDLRGWSNGSGGGGGCGSSGNDVSPQHVKRWD